MNQVEGDNLINDFTYNTSTHGVEVFVTPRFIPEKSIFDKSYYFFSYQVTITNTTNETVQILKRHWVIRDGQKRQRYINGDGLVGKTPKLAPGESFQYTSFCPLNTPTGNMRGKYQLKREDGELFWIEVPLFFFRASEFIQ